MWMRYKLLLILFALLPVLSFAQDEDLELWGSMKFSKKLTKKFRFELEEQIRWADSLSQYKKNFTDLGFKYKLQILILSALIFLWFLNKEFGFKNRGMPMGF